MLTVPSVEPAETATRMGDYVSMLPRCYPGTRNVVGAAGFEPAAPCAQGRRPPGPDPANRGPRPAQNSLSATSCNIRQSRRLNAGRSRPIALLSGILGLEDALEPERDFTGTILSAWQTSNRVTTALVRQLPEAVWKAPLPGLPRK